jgi:hypothetical protein
VATVISVTVALAVMHHVDLAVTLHVATVISVTVALAVIHLADHVQTHVEVAQADLAASAQAAHAQRAATNYRSEWSGLIH